MTLLENEPKIKALYDDIERIDLMLTAYKNKPTGTNSREIRKKLIELKKNIPDFNRSLTKADRKGYKQYR
jgi:predicted DNA-binding protein YlxM (UPF0122 family)